MDFTTDNYMLRMFCIGFTKRRPNQVKRTCYAQASQIRQVLISVHSYSVLRINLGAACLLLSAFLACRSAARWLRSW